MITKYGIKMYAQAISDATVKARLTYEDKVEIRDVLVKDVVEDELKIQFVLDDADDGKITKIELLDKDGVVLIDRPFLFEKTDDYNVWVLFRLRLREEAYRSK